ncbi:helix-turn-helix domain-containing protein [Sulfitobacter aestuarii]|uniref:Helix-turn-helix domain-containing protein n=1 Tax=Sulfitobacter aestuarii TaxID=2161676 RepID=A0ABW5U6U3_9RHOB
MFGRNLRLLSRDYPSVSDLSRRLGINRTQFNRYVSGESFPRPDVLARICRFFDVDARILLEPLEEIAGFRDPISGRFLRDFIGAGARYVPTADFPSGFYRLSRRSFANPERFNLGLVHIRRDGTNTYLRGYDCAEVMQLQGLENTPRLREFRGVVTQQDGGIAIISSRRDTFACSFKYLSRVASVENNFWLGYITRTIPENLGGLRATRLAFEHLGNDLANVLAVARGTGLCDAAELPPFHRRLLRPEVGFS